jgi:hypothetical protein
MLVPVSCPYSSTTNLWSWYDGVKAFPGKTVLLGVAVYLVMKVWK